MNKQPKTVALVDWYWAGHHPMYFNHFIMALEELGIDVLAFCPDPAEAEQTANETRPATGAAIANFGRTQFHKIRVANRRFGYLRPARIGAIDWTIRHFAGIENQVRQCAQESGRIVDAIYYACIYDWDFEWIRFSEPFLRFPWVGLYLQAISYRMPGQPNPLTGKVPSPKQMFGGRLCKGIDLLDEGIVNQVAQTIGKPVMALPDLVDARRAGRAEDRVLSENLKRFADGRPIVGLFGHLKKSKGILSFLEAARMPGASGICFALAGELVWPSGEGERNRIERALAECPNVWNHLARVPGERPLNELMAACDVLCAAYLDFPHSSAIQSKAAVFEKPLIVSEGYLMAERTRRFRMGEIVPQDDAVALLEAILRITKDSAAWVAENCPHWAEYTREHSFERFKTNVAKVLALTPETADCES